MSSTITPQMDDIGNRWVAIKQASPNHAISYPEIIKILRIVAGITNDRVLEFLLRRPVDDYSSEKQQAYLEKHIVDTLSQEEYALLLAYLKDEKRAEKIVTMRPTFLRNRGTILGTDFTGKTPAELSILLKSFRLIRTNFTEDLTPYVFKVVNDLPQAWGMIGNLTHNGMTLTQYVQLLAAWSEHNANQDVFMADPGLNRIICQTPDGVQHSMIDFIRKYMQNHDPQIQHVHFVPEAAFHNRLEHTTAEAQAAQNLLHNTDDYYAGQDYNYARKFYVPRMDDLGIIMAYEDALDFTTDIANYLPGQNITAFSEARPSAPLGTQDVLLPFMDGYGIYQAAYATAVNNKILRNAFSEYKKAINNISSADLEQILNSDDTQARKIERVKELAKNNFATSMFNETIYAGATGTIFFAESLALIVGAWAGLAYIPGVVLTYYFAKKNKYLLQKKIANFIDDDQINQLIVKNFNSHKSQQRYASADFDTKALHKIASLNNIFSLGARAIVTVSFGALLLAPIFISLAPVIRMALSWKSANLHLLDMRTHPIAALDAARNVKIEEISATSNRFSRNEFKQFLLNKGIDAIATKLKIIPKFGKLEIVLSNIMSFLGLWENARFDQILQALDDPSNPAAIAMRDDLMNECAAKVFDQKLTKHLQKYGAALDLSGLTVQQLQSDPNNAILYNKLLRHYLNETATNNAGKVVWSTGKGTIATVILVIIALTITFTPGGQLVWVGLAAAAVGILLFGYIATKYAAYKEQQKMRKAVEAIPDKDIPHLLKSTTKKIDLPFSKTFIPIPRRTPGLPHEHAIKLSATYKPLEAKQDLRHSAQHLCSNIVGEQFIARQAVNDVIDIHLLAPTDPAADASNKLLSIYAPLRINNQTVQNANLHDGSQRAWQFYLIGISDLKDKTCSFTLGTNLTPELAEQRAHNFIQAMLIEFEAEHNINFRTKLEFADPETAFAIYKVLLQPNASLDKLRMHFGLLSTFIPYESPAQNTTIFAKHMPYIQQKMQEQPDSTFTLHY